MPRFQAVIVHSVNDHAFHVPSPIYGTFSEADTWVYDTAVDGDRAYIYMLVGYAIVLTFVLYSGAWKEV